MEIIDVLTPITSEAPKFTVRMTPIYAIPDNGSGALSDFIFYVNGAATVKKTFQSGDNLQILSAGFMLPESFVLSTTWSGLAKANTSQLGVELRIGVYKASASMTQLSLMPGVGDRGTLVIPFSDFELGVNIFSDCSQFKESFILRASLFAPDISMVGVPSALDTKVQYIVPFIKVLHTLPIV